MITRNLGFAIGYAVLIVLAALSASTASDHGWIPNDMPDRVMGIIAGLTVAVFSNPVAKRLPGEAAKPGQAAFKRFFARRKQVAADKKKKEAAALRVRQRQDQLRADILKLQRDRED